MRSTFTEDLMASVRLEQFLDEPDSFYSYLVRHPDACPFFTMQEHHRTSATILDLQYRGIDVVCTMPQGGEVFLDEKAALDYAGAESPLRTFAFELGSVIHGHYSEGWLTDPEKYTQYYILAWPHMAQGPQGPYLDFSEVMIISRSDVLDIVQQDMDMDADRIRCFSRDIVENGRGGAYGLCAGHSSSRIERTYGPAGALRVIHTLSKAERPLNCVIRKELLLEKAGYIFFAARSDSSRYRVKRIAHYHHNTFANLRNFTLS